MKYCVGQVQVTFVCKKRGFTRKKSGIYCSMCETDIKKKTFRSIDFHNLL